MEHSKRFYDVKYYYDTNRWNKKRVHRAVGLWITVDEYKEITNEDYQG